MTNPAMGVAPNGSDERPTRVDRLKGSVMGGLSIVTAASEKQTKKILQGWPREERGQILLGGVQPERVVEDLKTYSFDAMLQIRETGLEDCIESQC